MSDAWFDRSFQATMEFARDGIKALVVANGGAVLALLTFAGNADPKVIDAADLATSLIWFAWGMTGGLVCGLLAYVTQYLYSHSLNKYGVGAHFVTIGFALASISAFMIGAYVAAGSFQP